MRLKLYFVFLLAILPTVVNALGVGRLDLKSKLNEPFEARISLLSVKADDLDSLNINLADANAFARVGLDRPFVLSQLKFALSRSTNNEPDYIRVFSSQPIREPFLNFLIEVNWSNGRLYREYSVLLDPISYNPNTKIAEFKQKVQQAKEAATAEAVLDPDGHDVVYADGFETDSATSADSSSASPNIDYSGGDYGPTSKLDTLWSIAKAMRPDQSVSVNQMMLALFKANQDAFYQQNINTLKSGQILRMPSESEINALTHAQSLTEVKSQHEAWDGVQHEPSTVQERAISNTAEPSVETDNNATTNNTIEAVEEIEPVEDVSEITPELKLVAAQGSDQVASVGNNDLILAQESIQALTQENLELKDRMEESETIISELQQELERLLAIQDNQLAEFQELAAKDPDPAAMQEEVMEDEETSTAEEVVEEEDFVAEEVVEEEGFVAEEVVEEETVLEESADQESSEEIIQQAPIASEDSSSIFSNPLILGGIVVLVLGLGVAIFIFIRKKSAKSISMNDRGWRGSSQAGGGDDLDELLDELDQDKENGQAETADNLDATAAHDGTPEINDLDLEIDIEEQQDDPVSSDANEELADDSLQEINTYLAFEQFDQAEELVRNAIEQEPDNSEYYLKLLEVFYTSGNKKEYEVIAKTLQDKTAGQGEHWEMAVAMWNEISPNRPLFESSGEEDQEEEDEEQNTTFVDLTTDDEAVKEEDDNDLDFDIGGVDESEEVLSETSDETDIIAGSGDDVEDSNEIDFDIGGVDESEEALSETSDETVEFDLADSETAATDDNLLDFDIGGVDESEEALSETSDETVEFDLADSETEATDDNLLDFDIGAETDNAGDEAEIDIDLASSEEEPEPDSAEEDSISIDDLETDDAEDAFSMDIDLTDDETEIAIEATEDSVPELDISLDAGNVEEEWSTQADEDILENTLQMPNPEELESIEIEEDDIDSTVFVPRTSEPDEQSAEDEVATKLDLAKAYVELGDTESAKTLLGEIIEAGTDEQKQQAQDLLAQT